MEPNGAAALTKRIKEMREKFIVDGNKKKSQASHYKLFHENEIESFVSNYQSCFSLINVMDV